MNKYYSNNFEDKVVDWIAKIGPWLAPVPTAYLVGKATVQHLGWPVVVGIVAAVVIESLGLVTCSTALDLRNFNQRRRKTDAPAPFWLAVVLIGLYFLIALGLTVVLDIDSSWARFAPAIFPALSLAGATLIALRQDHRQRILQIEQDRLDRKTERQTERMAKRLISSEGSSSEMSNIVSPDTSLSKMQAGRKAKMEARMDKLLTLYRDHPDLGASDAARALGIARQTVYSYRTQLERAGLLPQSNRN